MRPIDATLKGRDHIRAVVVGTGVNQDGKTTGIILPNGDAQEALIRRTYQRSGCDIPKTRYIEAHGTGTVAGDLAEMSAIRNVFGSGDKVFVGSIKSNMGHLEASSGLAGVLKAVLMLENACIAPNADFKTPKDGLALEGTSIDVSFR